MTMRTLFRTLAVVVFACGTLQQATAASTDRTALYGLTSDGTLVSISMSTGATTVIRHLPFIPGVSEAYHNLAVYKGTFLTGLHTGFMAFGAQDGDQTRLSALADSNPANLTEYPSTGYPRSWAWGSDPTGHNIDWIEEWNPVTGAATNLSSTSTIQPVADIDPSFTACTNQVLESTFFGNAKSYFIRPCPRTDGYSEGTYPGLVRAELQSGVWVKTMDQLILGVGAIAADPTTDGILWVGGGYPVPAALTKLNLNTSPFTYTTFSPTLLGTSAPIVGMAFGPPTSDVLSPKDVSDLAPFTSKPWTPIAMLLHLQ